MNQCGNVDELHDHREIDMSGVDRPGSAAREQSQERTKSFASAANRVNDVAFDCWVECRCLLRDAAFDLFKVRLNQFCDFGQTKYGRAVRLRNCAATRAPIRAGEEFHEARIVVQVAGCQSNITPSVREYCRTFGEMLKNRARRLT